MKISLTALILCILAAASGVRSEDVKLRAIPVVPEIKGPTSKKGAAVPKKGSFRTMEHGHRTFQEKEAARMKPASVPAWQTKYTLGAGDTLTFSVYDRPDLKRKKVRIAPDGTVSYLQAVAVKAKGLTPDQLRSRIEKELAPYQKNAKVMVCPDEIESKSYAIIGKVRNPGSFVLDRPTTILEAIATAKGVQIGSVAGANYELADFNHSFVARRGRKLDVDFAKLYFEGDFSQNAYLEPDDYVYIASNLQNEVYVLGSVKVPGRLKMPSDLTVVGAIAHAGGFQDRAYKMRVLLVRGSIHRPITYVVDVKAIIEGRAPDIKLKSRDIVYVNLRPFEMAERVLEGAIVAYMQTVTAQYLNLNYNPLTL